MFKQVFCTFATKRILIFKRTFLRFCHYATSREDQRTRKARVKKAEIEVKLHELYEASSLKSSAIYKHIAETKYRKPRETC